MNNSEESQTMYPPHRLLIVGAGLTGSVTASLLKQKFPLLSVTFWEKSRGAGGRFNTNRSSVNAQATVDLGAQYISATPEYARTHQSFYKELISSNVLTPFCGHIEGENKHDGMEHFIAPSGINTVVKHFLRSSGAKVCYETHCDAINICNKPENGLQSTWEVMDLKGNTSEFDSVMITIPTPQLLKLKGSIQDFLDKRRSLLEKAQYSSRYAMALYFKLGDKIDVPWTAKYVVGDPCVRFMALDARKRFGKDPEDTGPSLLIHTSVPFGIKHLEMDLKDVAEIIIEHIKQLLPALPEPIDHRCLRWRYSQVSHRVEDIHGSVVLSDTPFLIACGDAFTHSNFDGCIESALSAVEGFSRVLQANSTL